MEKVILNDDLEEILKKIKNLDINILTPIEAMKVIIEIKQKADNLNFSNLND
jgi:hypothetical protein